MSNINSINSLITNPTTSAASTTNNGTNLGADEFLQLLTAQLKNQDPLKPMDNTQSVAQLAQFSALQSSQALQAQFATFESNFSVMQSAGLLGKNVSVQVPDANGNQSTVQGVVKSINVVNGIPELTIADKNGKLLTDANGAALVIPTSSILSIG